MDRNQRVGIAGLLVLGLLLWASLGVFAVTRTLSTTSGSANTGASGQEDGARGADDDEQGDDAGDAGGSGTQGGRKGDHVNGTVTAKADDTLTVLDGAGTSHTVVVTDATIYRLRGRETGTLADLGVGSRIKATGSVSGEVLTASSIRIRN